MTAKCTFCNDTKQEPGVPGPCVWCEVESPAAVERHTIANLRYAGGKEHDVRYVSEVHYDAALAREVALREDRDAWKSTAETFEDFYRKTEIERDAAIHRENLSDKHIVEGLERDAALREELEKWQGIAGRRTGERTEFINERNDAQDERDALQQRLTVAEHRIGGLEGVLRNVRPSCHPKHIALIDAALKPAAEVEGS